MSSNELTYSEKCFNKDRIKFQQKMINLDHWQCCQNCDNMDHSTNICKLFNLIPPVQVMAVGCEQYRYEIPF